MERMLKKAPIMVLMGGNEEAFGLASHWVVLVSLSKGFFTYLDPWYKSHEQYIQHISYADFKNCYTGIALQILSNQRTQ